MINGDARDEEEKKGRTEDKNVNLQEAILALDAEDKKELDSLHAELTHIKVHSEAQNLAVMENLKKRVALFFFALSQKTSNTFQGIRKTAYIFSGFDEYELGNDLNEITEIAKSLGESWEDVEGSVRDQWEKLQNKLEDYRIKLE